MPPTMEWRSLPVTGYCTSDSLLGLVAFAVDQGMEALATGPLVSLLVFRHKGEPQLMPLWGESWREIDREARKLIADAAEPIDECVVVTHEFGDEGAVAVLAVACERGHGGSLAFKQVTGGAPEYVGTVPPLLPGWRGEPGLPAETSDRTFHAMVLLPHDAEVTLGAVSALLTRARRTFADRVAATHALLTAIFADAIAEPQVTITEERARVLLSFGAWSVRIGIVEDDPLHHRAHARFAQDATARQRIAEAGSLRIEVWTDPIDGGGVKPDFGDVMDELAEGFSAPVVIWRPGPS